MKSNQFLSIFALVALIGFAPLSVKAVEVGEEAPCVVLDGINSEGETVNGCIRDQERESQSFTFLEFFSIRCSTCQKNLPKVSRLSQEILDTTTVRMVSIDRDVNEIRQYLHEKAELIQFPVAFDTVNDAKRAYDVFKTPTAFLLDSNNRVLFKHSGELKAEDLEEIKRLVQAQDDTDPDDGACGGGNHLN